MKRLGLLLALALFGCPRTAAPGPGGTPAPAGVALEGARLVENGDGQRIWEVEAVHVDYRTAAGVAELKQVRARFYQDGKPASVGLAPRAVFHLKDRTLDLEGGIRVEAAAHDRGFTAERVRWAPAPGRLEASGHVSFWRGPNRLTADRLLADRRLARVELTGGVHGVATLTPEGTPAWGSPSNPSRGMP